MHVIVILGTSQELFDENPLYLKSYDPDGNDGHGDIEVTTNKEEAKLFASGADAMDEWMKVSTTHPTRADGKPNRPLSAYTIETRPV